MNNIGAILGFSQAAKYGIYNNPPSGESSYIGIYSNTSRLTEEQRYQLWLDNEKHAMIEREEEIKRLELQKEYARKQCKEDQEIIQRMQDDIQDIYEKNLFEKFYLNGSAISPNVVVLVKKTELSNITELKELFDLLIFTYCTQENVMFLKSSLYIREIKDLTGNVIFDRKDKFLDDYEYRYIYNEHNIFKKPSINDKNSIFDFNKKYLILADLLHYMNQDQKVQIEVSGDIQFEGTVYQLMWVCDDKEPHIHPLTKRILLDVTAVNDLLKISVSKYNGK